MTGSFQVRTLRGLSVPVLFSLPLTACFIHLFGFKQIYRFAGRLARLISKWLPLPDHPAVKAEQIARTVIVVNRRLSFYQASCLVESLLLWGILSGYGIDARLCLGVRTITGPLFLFVSSNVADSGGQNAGSPLEMVLRAPEAA